MITIPPQLELARQLKFTDKCFSFKINNATANVIECRLFGSLADLTRISSNSVSTTSENVMIPTLTDTTLNYADYDVDDTKIQNYATEVNNYVLNLNSADGLTSSVGNVEITATDLADFIRNNPAKFPVSEKWLQDMMNRQTKNVKVITAETAATMITSVSVGNTPAQQTGLLPFIIDGNFYANLTATCININRKIADLWSYIIGNDLRLKAILIDADDADAVVSEIKIEKINPFHDADNEILALSKYQNPYVVNANMGLVHDIDIVVDKNRYFKIPIYPQTTTFHFYFD